MYMAFINQEDGQRVVTYYYVTVGKIIFPPNLIVCTAIKFYGTLEEITKLYHSHIIIDGDERESIL